MTLWATSIVLPHNLSHCVYIHACAHMHISGGTQCYTVQALSHIKQIGDICVKRNQIIREVKIRLHYLIFCKFLTIIFYGHHVTVQVCVHMCV